jgi:hypothetical protein
MVNDFDEQAEVEKRKLRNQRREIFPQLVALHSFKPELF